MKRISLLIGIWLATPAFAAESPTRETIEHVKQATVFVRVESGTVTASGSGVLVARRDNVGYVVTNAHVLLLGETKHRSATLVFRSGTDKQWESEGELVHRDENLDIAVLKVESEQLGNPLTIDPDVELYETMQVYICGFPFGDRVAVERTNPAISISVGRVSALRGREKGTQLFSRGCNRKELRPLILPRLFIVQSG